MDIQSHQHISYAYSAKTSNEENEAIGKIKDENSQAAQLTESEASKQQIVRELSARDREVRAHEQAHKAVAGQLSQGAPSYTYERGPNGQLYAVGGEVQIDTSAVKGDPQATIQKAEQIKRAALAPANPSAQDRSVAAQATQMAAQARAELQAETTAHELNKEDNSTGDTQNTETAKEPNNVKAEFTNEQINAECAMCGGKHSADTHILLEATPVK